MHGAKSPHTTDWSPLKDRSVTVWPDHDKPGAEFSKKAAKLAQDAGAAWVRIVKLPAELPEGWDLAETPPLGSIWTDCWRMLLNARLPRRSIALMSSSKR